MCRVGCLHKGLSSRLAYTAWEMQAQNQAGMSLGQQWPEASPDWRRNLISNSAHDITVGVSNHLHFRKWPVLQSRLNFFF